MKGEEEHSGERLRGTIRVDRRCGIREMRGDAGPLWGKDKGTIRGDRYCAYSGGVDQAVDAVHQGSARDDAQESQAKRRSAISKMWAGRGPEKQWAEGYADGLLS